MQEFQAKVGSDIYCFPYRHTHLWVVQNVHFAIRRYRKPGTNYGQPNTCSWEAAHSRDRTRLLTHVHLTLAPREASPIMFRFGKKAGSSVSQTQAKCRSNLQKSQGRWVLKKTSELMIKVTTVTSTEMHLQ